MSSSLEVLAHNRDALLLAEVAAWLHMFGKLQEDFLDSEFHKFHLAHEIPKEIQTNFSQLDTLLKDNWFGSIWKLLPLGGTGTERLTFAQLIKTHEEVMSKYTEGFRKLLIDAHGRGSGIEKGILDRFAPSHKKPVYLATPLGSETSIKITDIQAAQQSLYSFLQVQLDNLKAKNARLAFDEWIDFRDKLMQIMQQCYSITVAETRRPLNDVTLFDQTAISVAFFKAALAQNLLLGKWKDPSQEEVANKYHCRLLKIGLDSLSFWGNTTHIGDLLARKGHIDEALNKVRLQLEIMYPLGFEVYRDENGSIFIVPDVENLLDYIGNSQSLGELIQSITNQEFSGETALSPSLSSSTRDALLFGRLASATLPQPTPRPSWLKQQWQNQRADICAVCGLRPQGPSKKSLSRKVCDICQGRRLNRSEQWIKNPSTTIWIDEVADTKGRLALLVAHFDLKDWLSGTAFNTVLSINPENRQLTDKQQSPNYDFDLDILIKDIQNGLTSGHQFENNLLGYLVPQKKRGGSDIVQDFYDLHVTHTDLGIFSSVPKPELLALSMIRQSPSFARISRTWKTTKKFWEKIESSITVDAVNARLKFQGVFLANTAKDTLAVSHTYELKLGNINLSIVCTKEREFLTVDNLKRTASLLGLVESSEKDYSIAATRVQKHLQGKTFEIEAPTGYGSPNTLLGRLRIEEVTLVEDSYLPAISILTEPRTFMTLVPANEALNVAKAIKVKYEEEISKVRNRLPLKIGIAFADRRTPLPAILDAGRRMLRQPAASELWKIKEVRPLHLHNSWADKVSLILEKDGQSLPMTIKTVMGDKSTEDVWYPYWCVEKDINGATPAARKRQFKGVNDKAWVHTCDLREGDVVHLLPSRFDFEFLDTAARRFEVSYDNGKRRGTVHSARPYYLEQLDDFEKLWTTLSTGLETTQIHNLVGIIEATRMEWGINGENEVFKQAVRDALDNAEWKHRPDIETLLHAALSGQLADVVELYMKILKPKVDEQQI